MEYRTLLLEDWTRKEQPRPRPQFAEWPFAAGSASASALELENPPGLPPGQHFSDESAVQTAFHHGEVPEFNRPGKRLKKQGRKKLTMRINLRFHGLKPRPLWRRQVEKEIRELERVAAISVADVVLERRREAGPLFRMRALLAVPGPDFHAEGRDHTFPAALRKLVSALARQIQQRKSRRLQRRSERLRNSPLGTGFGLLAVGRR